VDDPSLVKELDEHKVDYSGRYEANPEQLFSPGSFHRHYAPDLAGMP